MTQEDLPFMTDNLPEDAITRRVVRAIEANGHLTATQVAHVEGMYLWDVVGAMVTLSGDGRLLHSHTTHTGEEAWKIKTND